MVQGGAARAGIVDDVPPVTRRPDPRLIRLWRTEALLWTGAASLGIVALTRLLDWGIRAWIAAAILALAGAACATLLPPARVRAWSFEVGENEVRIRRGVLWRTESVVLHSRIQHVDTRRGPLERAFGLASVVLFTAGSVGASISIPGLLPSEAESLRDHLAALSDPDDGV